MPTTQPSDLILASVLAEEFSKGIAGMNVWGGSGAFTVNPGLQASAKDVGTTVTVPYFENIGKAQKIPAGGALTPKKMTMSSESGTVIHLGDAVSTSGWASRAKAQGRSIYDVAVEQLVAGFNAKLDDEMADAVIARAVAAGMIYDGSAANFAVADVVGVQKLFGDELASGGGIAGWAMQSKPFWDAAQIADSTGRNLLTGVGEGLEKLAGKPVMLTDRATLLVASTSPQQYYTAAAKRGAGAVWFNQNIVIENDRDSLADVDLLVYHVYLTVHVYGTMPSGTKCGVAAAKSL